MTLVNYTSEVSVYQKPLRPLKGYDSIDTLQQFPFSNVDISKAVSDTLPADDVVENMMRDSKITAVVFRDENDKLFKLETLIPFSFINGNYCTSFCFSGQHYIRQEDLLLSFFSDTALTVIQTTSGLASIYTKVAGIFYRDLGYCGRTSDAKLFLIDSIVISTSIDTTSDVDHHSV
jgi:hypothetical protein